MIDPKRRSDRINGALLRLEVKRAVRPIAVIAIGFLAAGLAARYVLSNINGGIGATHTMRMEVADATGVVPGRAEVRFYGIQAGQVTDVQLKGGKAIITATVAEDMGDVYKDATVEVRPNTALQDMYVDVLNRGTKAAGVAGSNDVIPLEQSRSPVNLADVLNTFQPDVRSRVATTLDQLGNGLEDRGYALRRSFALFAPFFRDVGEVSRQISVRADTTKQLIRNASELSELLGSRSTQLRDLVTKGNQTLEAASTDGSAPLRATIAKLPGTFDTAAGTLQALANARPNLDAAVTSLVPVAKALPDGLDDAKRLAKAIDPAMVKLQAPVRQLVPVAEAIRPFTRNLTVGLRRTVPQVGAVNTLAKDFADCVPFINEFWMWDASMSKYRDSFGPQVRGNVNFGLYTVPGQKPKNYVHDYTCAGGPNAPTIGAEPTPKYPGPPPTP